MLTYISTPLQMSLLSPPELSPTEPNTPNILLYTYMLYNYTCIYEANRDYYYYYFYYLNLTPYYAVVFGVLNYNSTKILSVYTM